LKQQQDQQQRQKLEQEYKAIQQKLNATQQPLAVQPIPSLPPTPLVQTANVTAVQVIANARTNSTNNKISAVEMMEGADLA
jgi:hypothetical protein